MTDIKSDNDASSPETVQEQSVSDKSLATGTKTESTASASEKHSVKSAAATHATSAATHTATHSERKAPIKKRRIWPAVLSVFVIVIGAAGAAVYWQWLQVKNNEQQIAQQFTDQKQLTERVQSQLQSQLQTLQQSVNTTTEKLNQQQALSSDIEKQNSDLRKQIADLQTQLESLTTTDNDDWKLAEAQYLTQLANQRLVMERNTVGALNLLEAADKIVKASADPGLFTVREQLSEDITELKLVNSVDREGIYLSLSSINKAFVLLPRPIPEEFKKPTKTSAVTQSDLDDGSTSILEKIKRSFVNAFDSLKNFIRINHYDEPVAPLLPPEGQEYLLTSLRLLIESAQLALMREQQTVYEDSLGNAQNLLARYYPLSPEAKTLAQQIKELQQMSVVQTLPDISGSPQQLTDYLENRHKVGSNAGEQSTKAIDNASGNASSNESGSANSDASGNTNSSDSNAEPTP